MLNIYYRISGHAYRVWCDDWEGDQFEIFSEEQLNWLKVICQRLGLSLVEMED